MSTISDKLLYLNETKSQIKEAIISKGQTIDEDDTFRSYVDKIMRIQTEGGVLQFDSIAEMQAYQDAEEGDLAVVYGNKYVGTYLRQNDEWITQGASMEDVDHVLDLVLNGESNPEASMNALNKLFKISSI